MEYEKCAEAVKCIGDGCVAEFEHYKNAAEETVRKCSNDISYSEDSVIYLPAARWKMSNIFFACGGLPLRGHFVTTLWQCAKKAHDIRFVHINYINGLRLVPPLGNVVNVCI